MGYRIRNTDHCVGTCGPNEIIQLDFLSFFMPSCCVNTSHNSLKWSFLNNKQNRLKESKIKKELKILFKEIGRQVTESEATKWS